MNDMPPPHRPVLPLDYYVRNFFLIVDTVLDRDGHLFTEDERRVIRIFECLLREEQRLYIRMFNRRGPYFRLDRLSYPEIPALHTSAARLAEAGFAHRYRPGQDRERRSDTLSAAAPPPLDIPHALRAYTVKELRGVERKLGIHPPRKERSATRKQILERLSNADPRRLEQALLQLGELIAPAHVPLMSRIHRLFFLQSHQDAATLVTKDLSLVQYPTYRVRRSRPVFADREAFEAWIRAHDDYERLLEALDTNDSLDIAWFGQALADRFLHSPPPSGTFLDRLTARDVAARGAWRYARWMEKSVGPAEAEALYEKLLHADCPPRLRGRIWERLALLQEKRKARRLALATCAAGLKDPATRRSDRLALMKRHRRLSGTADAPRPAQRITEVRIHAPLQPPERSGRLMIARRHGSPVHVEEAALEAFRRQGYQGMVTENLFFTTIAGILFWDIIFADIPDVFLTPFQDAPLDFLSDEFHPRRRDLLEARLETIASGDLSLLSLHYKEHYGRQARGVSWSAFSLKALQTGAARLGPARLSAILGHLLEDYRHRHVGFPDLLLWKAEAASIGPAPHAPDEFRDDTALTDAAPIPGLRLDPEWQERPDLLFAEVKSPRDRLSPAQEAWMEWFLDGGIAVVVARVVPLEEATTD